MDRVIDHEPELRSIAKQSLEGPRILRGGDDEDFPNTRLNERGERVINHRLVINGHELLRDALGNRVEPRAGTAGQDDAFHLILRVQRQVQGKGRAPILRLEARSLDFI